jgi:hypothetical protein
VLSFESKLCLLAAAREENSSYSSVPSTDVPQDGSGSSRHLCPGGYSASLIKFCSSGEYLKPTLTSAHSFEKAWVSFTRIRFNRGPITPLNTVTEEPLICFALGCDLT